MIRVEDLHKSFGKTAVLQGVSFQVDRGRILALIGRSGYGKSVLLKHVAGLLKPDRGRVLVDGKDMGALRGRQLLELRDRLGFLFQGGALFDSMTVFENVAFPLREKTRLKEKEIRDRALFELDQVGLIGSEEKHPSQISGGMIKRAALARALVEEPEIMLFDEPTTGLDPLTGHAILALIDACHRRIGFTGIIVTHEIPGIFSIVDQVTMLHEGRIRFTGSPEQMMASSDPVVRPFVRAGEDKEETAEGGRRTD
ncbi:MAG: ATP-binding cassette domain-containing protein [Deltaproteobacteria bacterium]|nr:ATP-binding cassette domain-containing protein [Deltaproteobacteria bacterium]